MVLIMLELASYPGVADLIRERRRERLEHNPEKRNLAGT